MENEYIDVDYLVLPKNTVLNNKYQIKNMINKSNLSIVYLAINLESNTKVIIKEFYPVNQVLRDLDAKRVVCKNNLYKDKFSKEKSSFLGEAEVMKELEDDYIAKCYEYFKENNTAYIVIEYYEGLTLDKYLEEKGDFDQFFKDIFSPLLTAINKIHQKNYIHRDIKPSNIIIYQDKPVLIDFGSAVNYKENDVKKILLTPGFSPIEFYSERSKQGPYSDIYSLSAILYYYFSNQIPDEALDRIIEDDLEAVTTLNQDIPDSLNNIIMKNMSLDYKRRDKSITIFKLKLWRLALSYKFKDILTNRFGRIISENTYFYNR
jgi:serine/threonine protein kinase